MDEREITTKHGILDTAAWNTLTARAQTLPGAALRLPGGTAPVHTLYGGAHLFKAGTTARLGALAVAHLAQYAPDAAALAQALGRAPHTDDAVGYEMLARKLRSAPIEDLRIDFEDGYGVRGDADEDAQAARTGGQVAEALAQNALPPRFGLRIKALTPDTWRRGARTLDLFCAALARGCDAHKVAPPAALRVTVPKVEHVAQAAQAAALAEAVETALEWPSHTLALELMVESPVALCDATGANPLRRLVAAAGSRCRDVHLGAYDYLAACGVTSVGGGLRHPACDLARGLMRLGVADTDVRLADGATQVLPLPRHTPADTPQLQQENTRVIHAAWRLHAGNVTHALNQGFYQGWDLHPAQLIPRYAAVYRYFRDQLPVSCRRLQAFLDKAATAATVGEYFDDAASALGLVQFFRQGLSCGALDAAAVAPTGLAPGAFETHDLRALAHMRPAPGP